MTNSVMTAPPGKKWHPSQEGDLNMSWHKNQDGSSGRAPRNPEVRGSDPGSGPNFSLEIL